MVVLGVVLLGVAVVLTAAAITSNGHSAKFDLWGVVHSTMSVGAIFLMGMITTVIGVFGILVIVGGMRRGRRRRREHRELARRNRELTGDSHLGGAREFDDVARSADPPPDRTA